MRHPNERAAVINMQRYLRQLSYHDPDIPAPPVDGVFDTDTKASLKAFQKKEGLPPTGAADLVTWELLFARYLASVQENSTPLAALRFPRSQSDFTIGMGADIYLVRVIQFMLNELMLDYDFPQEVTLTGVYDAPTAAAVRAFQEVNRLPPTGLVDRATWDALARVYDQTFINYFPQ